MCGRWNEELISAPASTRAYRWRCVPSQTKRCAVTRGMDHPAVPMNTRLGMSPAADLPRRARPWHEAASRTRASRLPGLSVFVSGPRVLGRRGCLFGRSGGHPRRPSPLSGAGGAGLLSSFSRQQCLYFFPEPQRQSSLRPGRAAVKVAISKQCKRLRQTQHLSRFDLVGIGQLVLIQLENFHVRAGAAKVFFGNGAQGVTGLDRVGLSLCRRSGAPAPSRPSMNVCANPSAMS